MTEAAGAQEEVECDLDAITAEKDAKPPFPFKFDGETYELPSDPDVRAAAAFGGERLYEGFALLLGAEQWERLQASDKTFGNRHFEKLVKDYQTYLGVDLGESKASPRSSRNTAKR